MTMKEKLKTFQQLEWADKVAKHTGKPVIIFAPLGVVGQTINEHTAQLRLDL